MPKFVIEVDTDTAMINITKDGQILEADELSVAKYKVAYPACCSSDESEEEEYVVLSYSKENEADVRVTNTYSFEIEEPETMEAKENASINVAQASAKVAKSYLASLILAKALKKA